MSLDRIAKAYPKGGEINPTELLKLKVIKKKKGWIPEIKILSGKTSFTVAIQVSKCLVSDSAKENIIKAGGKVESLETENQKKEKNNIKTKDIKEPKSTKSNEAKHLDDKKAKTK